ncbi:MAG: ABC transporter permease [Candidatus Zixiibacteriota bacterium]|nr:MAG: ABC transporter permease [candidate division Zixibacteria bacterium]
MEIYSIRTLKCQPLRLCLSVCGLGLCIVLMLFLLATYSGVKNGSMEYVNMNRTDLWVLQKNATNILRCTSVLFPQHGGAIKNTPGVHTASPVLLILATIDNDNGGATVYLAGYDPATGKGGPPAIAEGRLIESDHEIILDRSFARKYGYRVGGSLTVQGDTLDIVGISTGTNAFVIQYAFVTIKKAQSLVNFPVATFYMTDVAEGHDKSEVASTLKQALPSVEVYDHETFVENNVRELQVGFLPFIYSIASIGVIVLVVILSLLLSINILERRKDFAIMKTMGSPGRFLCRLIVEQSLLLAAAATAVALILFFPLVELVAMVSPDVTVEPSLNQTAAVIIMVGVVGLLSAFISMQRLRNIYPLEAFS